LTVLYSTFTYTGLRSDYRLRLLAPTFASRALSAVAELLVLHAGEMSDCPGYLSITINDRAAGEQLFHYDVMMPCPSRFNLTFTVPRRSSSHTSQRPRQATKVQTFEVVLDDAKRVYRLLLTYFRSLGTAEDDGIAENGVSAEAYSSKVTQGHTTDVTNVVSACVMVVVICLSVRLLCDVTVLRREKPSVSGDHDDVTQPCSAGSVSTVDGPRRHHLVFLSMYVGLNVVYCLLVTFTAVSAVFRFHFRSEIDHVTTGGQRLGELTRRTISDFEKAYERRFEMEFQLAENRGRQVPVAYTRYIDDMTDVVRQSVFNATLRHHRQNSTSVSGLMSAVINSTAEDAEKWVLKYVDELDKEFERRANPVRLHQRRVRRRIANTGWLLYARSLFNRSTALASLTTSSSSSSSSATAAAGVDEVIRFLEETMSVRTARHRHWYKSADLQRSVVRSTCDRSISLLLIADVTIFTSSDSASCPMPY